MDKIELMMYGTPMIISKDIIAEIRNGKALTITNRWFDIICDQCEIDYEQPVEDYIVCNICNKVTYLKDLE